MPLPTNSIVTGDCFEVLDDLPEGSVHAVVTDPPYFLGDSGFMSRDWDDFSDSRQYQEWCRQWAELCRRVLKPGGHLLAFGGNTRHHRLFTGVEDAGFEIRDTLTWHYGSGFPKASDVSKTIDKRADAEREVTSVESGKDLAMQSGNYGNSAGEEDNTGELERRDKPATDAAREWNGWKTGLKPATEFVVMARKPFEGATVDSVLKHGTGALNIDETRIGTNEDTLRPAGTESENPGLEGGSLSESGRMNGGHTEGRYPSNVVFDETAAERLDEKNGTTVSQGGREEKASGYGSGNFGGTDEVVGDSPGFGDKGGPSRYFYTSKASRSERTENGAIDNDHPTVKPLDLAEWLIRLVTREGQVVLDPFTGSGTIPKAAKALNREFVGIEQQPRYADLARVRCGLTPNDPATVRSDDAQRGFEAYTDGGAD